MFLELIILAAFLAAYRLFVILPSSSSSSQNPNRHHFGKPNCKVAVFLGSGGHTSEALTLISALDPKRFPQRTYIVSSGDDLSVKKVLEFEAHLPDNGNCRILSIPRARQVHQPLITTPLTAISSLLFCVYHITLRPFFDPKAPNFADLLILNGPGTCFVLCIAVYINKFFGLRAPYVIYVETFARVKTLSLSGKLIRPFANKFLTQWPEVTGKTKPPSLSSDNWLV